MDKQKQILEIAEVIANYISSRDFEVKFITNPKSKAFQFSHTAGVAEDIYNAGYRKSPENAVVLTGMETEQRFEDLMVAFDEMGFMPNTTHPFPEEYVEAWKQRLIFVFGQLRKETAEKFAEMVSKAFIGLNCIDIDEWNWCQRKIDEICEEISEGNDGNYKQDCRLDSKRKL